MSAGSQIQMAPQSTVNSGQSVHSQDSNMSTGKFITRFQDFKQEENKGYRSTLSWRFFYKFSWLGFLDVLQILSRSLELSTRRSWEINFWVALLWKIGKFQKIGNSSSVLGFWVENFKDWSLKEEECKLQVEGDYWKAENQRNRICKFKVKGENLKDQSKKKRKLTQWEKFHSSFMVKNSKANCTEKSQKLSQGKINASSAKAKNSKAH